MPFHSLLLPVFIPLLLSARTNKELHFHLFKLTHAEYKLASHDLIAEGLTDLGYSKRYFHTSCLLHVQEVDKNSLGGFGTQINNIGFITYASHLGGKHQVELAHFCPVTGAAHLAYDLVVFYYFLQTIKIVGY